MPRYHCRMKAIQAVKEAYDFEAAKVVKYTARRTGCITLFVKGPGSIYKSC
jgi:hypothetical protein